MSRYHGIFKTDGNWDAEKERWWSSEDAWRHRRTPGPEGETPKVGYSEREGGTGGPVWSRQQTVRVTVNASGLPDDFVTPIQAEEEVVKDYFPKGATHFHGDR